jgi:hypothetical protein
MAAPEPSPSAAASAEAAPPAGSPEPDPSPAAAASPEPSPDPSAAAEGSPSPDPSAAAEGSPSPDSSAAAGASPEPDASASPATDETSPAEESESPGPGYDASAGASEKTTDPFDRILGRLAPFTYDRKSAAASARPGGPFHPLDAGAAGGATKSEIEKRVDEFLISGVFIGRSLRGIRLRDARVLVGQWFDEEKGTFRSYREGKEPPTAEFQLVKVTSRTVTFRHKSGAEIPRDTILHRQQALQQPSAAPSPAAEQATGDPAGGGYASPGAPASGGSPSPGAAP